MCMTNLAAPCPKLTEMIIHLIKECMVGEILV